MGHWGWRPLVCCIFISVWIAGCSNHSDLAPTTPPTQIPPVTLMLRITQQSPPTQPGLPAQVTMSQATPQVSRVGDRPALPSIAATPTPLPITLTAPTCYETFEGGVTCLGLVNNTTSNTLTRILIQADFYDPGGRLIATQIVTTDQQRLPTGDSAPYRALFLPEDSGYPVDTFGAVNITLLRAEPSTQQANTPGLIVDRIRNVRDGDIFTVNGTLTNTSNEAVPAVKLVVTLTDRAGHVAGFRSIRLESIPADDETPFTVSLRPFINDVSLQVHAHAEPMVD